MANNPTQNLPYKIIAKCKECGVLFKCGHTGCRFWQRREEGSCTCLSCYGANSSYAHSCVDSIEPLKPSIPRIKGKLVGEKIIQW